MIVKHAPKHIGMIGILLFSCSIAGAHDLPPPDDMSGFGIPAIDHASMQAIAPFRSRIVKLAGSVPVPSPHLSALLLYDQQQAANCLWEILPGSLSDEENPLNSCAHADMAGLKAILNEMLEIDSTRSSASALRSEIDYQMVMLGTSFETCAFSATTFNTASQVKPNWQDAVAYYYHGHEKTFWFGSSLILIVCGLFRWKPFASSPSNTRVETNEISEVSQGSGSGIEQRN